VTTYDLNNRRTSMIYPGASQGHIPTFNNWRWQDGQKPV